MQAVTTASDLELAEQAARNDQDAFGALYERHLAALYDYARRLMRDADEAADVVQVAFIKAFESMRRTGTAPATFRPWLFQIAHNEAFDQLRRKRFVDPEGEEALARVPDWSGEASPDALAERRETAELVWRAVRGLRPEEQELLVLSVREGLDAGQIAQVIGKRRETVHVALSRVRDGFEDAFTTLALLAQGTRACPELAALGRGIELSPRLRRQVRRHVEKCDICAENRRRCAREMAVFAVLPAVQAPTDVKAAMWRQIAESLNTQLSWAPHRDGRLGRLRRGTRAGARPWWTLLAVVAITVASLAAAVRIGVGRLPVADVVETPTPLSLKMLEVIATPVVSATAESTRDSVDKHVSDVVVAGAPTEQATPLVASVAVRVVRPEQTPTSKPTPTPEAPSVLLQTPTPTPVPSARPSPVEPEPTGIPGSANVATATAGPTATPEAAALNQTGAATPTAPPHTHMSASPTHTAVSTATHVPQAATATPTATRVPPTATPTPTVRAKLVNTLTSTPTPTPTPTPTRIPGA
jgi:RNA polymerase sigma factor (sigma-70 family)